MKKLILLFIIHYSLFITHCFSQSFTWQRIYDGPVHFDDYAYDICLSTDGHFYVVGLTLPMGFYVLKMNAYGDTIWTKAGGPVAYAVAPSGDGGCVLTGSGDSAFTIKLNGNGSIGWQKFYGGNYIDCYDIEGTSNGEYIACGSDRGSGFHTKGFILRADSSGNLIWQRRYSSNDDLGFSAIEEAIDGGYIIAGYIYDSPQDTAKAYLVKIDTSGDVVWERKFKVNNRRTGIEAMSKTSNGYLIGGTTSTVGYDSLKAYYVKTNINGDTIFSKVFGFPDQEVFKDLKTVNNNRNVISVLTEFDTARIIITDSSGNIMRQRGYKYGQFSSFNSVLPLSNGDIVFAGEAESEQAGRSDVYVIRTDSMLYATPIGIFPIQNTIPEGICLEQNFPNPFNNKTVITYYLDNKYHVRLSIYDILGREVSVLVDEYEREGKHQITWNANNQSSGLYFLRLHSESTHLTRKIILIK